MSLSTPSLRPMSLLQQYYSILSLFRDAVYSYHPTSWLGRAVLKTFPRSALVSTFRSLERKRHPLTFPLLLVGLHSSSPPSSLPLSRLYQQ